MKHIAFLIKRELVSEQQNKIEEVCNSFLLQKDIRVRCVRDTQQSVPDLLVLLPNVVAAVASLLYIYIEGRKYFRQSDEGSDCMNEMQVFIEDKNVENIQIIAADNFVKVSSKSPSFALIKEIKSGESLQVQITRNGETFSVQLEQL